MPSASRAVSSAARAAASAATAGSAAARNAARASASCRASSSSHVARRNPPLAKCRSRAPTVAPPCPPPPASPSSPPPPRASTRPSAAARSARHCSSRSDRAAASAMSSSATRAPSGSVASPAPALGGAPSCVVAAAAPACSCGGASPPPPSCGCAAGNLWARPLRRAARRAAAVRAAATATAAGARAGAAQPWCICGTNDVLDIWCESCAGHSVEDSIFGRCLAAVAGARISEGVRCYQSNTPHGTTKWKAAAPFDAPEVSLAPGVTSRRTDKFRSTCFSQLVFRIHWLAMLLRRTCGAPCTAGAAATRAAPRPHACADARRGPRRSVVMRGARISSPAADWIADNLGAGHVVAEKFLGGSNWASTYVYTTEDGSEFFAKNSGGAKAEAMFRGEALGLKAMYDTATVRIPNVHHVGVLANGRGAFIVMEYLRLGGATDQRELGRQMARMHLAEPTDPNAQAGQYGFAVDNTIGATPQPNTWCGDWVEFYRERRLRHQLDLLGDARMTALAQPVLDRLDFWFTDIQGTMKPSILHGDLWSGNIASADGRPTIFDPATYYGHAEAEWGMSWCAGLSGAFWDGYFEVAPKAPLFEQRRDLYTLYHILNHANLFGGGYGSQAQSILQRLNEQLKRGA
ncbi:MAG: Fructosamine kinase-domain-containing protein [Monoraphidium minutum]|nr:MAG: Fructosamine kinase-domain-containing protein [Monoraphidium minutum]